MKTPQHPNRMIEVLHKFRTTPQAANIITFTPTRPFKLSNILIWYSKPIIINQIRIGAIEQLTYPIYEQQLTAPNTLEIVEGWLKDKILPKMLRENHAYSLDFMTADREHSITIEFEGNFDVMALYGIEFAKLT